MPHYTRTKGIIDMLLRLVFGVVLTAYTPYFLAFAVPYAKIAFNLIFTDLSTKLCHPNLVNSPDFLPFISYAHFDLCEMGHR